MPFSFKHRNILSAPNVSYLLAAPVILQTLSSPFREPVTPRVFRSRGLIRIPATFTEAYSTGRYLAVHGLFRHTFLSRSLSRLLSPSLPGEACTIGHQQLL